MQQSSHNNNYSGQFHSGGSQFVGSNLNSGGGNIYIGSTEPTQAHDNSSLPRYSNDEIDRACLHALRCPDSFAVKNRLKETKDKLLLKSIEWIFHDDDYKSWQDGEDICLLWIKGGPGKGKTMMSIGLIEELSRRSRDTTVVSYFFCQNADYTLNTVEAIIKGLILQLLKRHDFLSKCLRDRWDPATQTFADNIDSRECLWNILLEMIEGLSNRTSVKVYLVIDALDECRGDGMANLLKAIVRTGLGNPSQVKWLLTSRPFDAAEQELLAGSEQVRVSLELNSHHISQAVQTYISHKMTELDRRWQYSTAERLEIEHELAHKAEDTFLWVNLVCKTLDQSTSGQALIAIRDIPPDLQDLYHQAYLNLQSQTSPLAKARTNLLDVMMLTFRRMHISEIYYIADLPKEQRWMEALIDQCHAFVTIRGGYIEFVHQSARDYLTERNEKLSVKHYNLNIHAEIATRCLDCLSRSLRQNLLNLSPDASMENVSQIQDETVLSLSYTATFWFRHLYAAREHAASNQALAQGDTVDRFLYAYLLDWLKCLSILDQTPTFLEGLQLLANMTSTNSVLKIRSNPSLTSFLLDAQRFVSRHHHTISKWPMQIFGSALVFSPESSLVKIANLDKVPPWFTLTPPLAQMWTPLVQTLSGHSGHINSLSFSSDGQHLASASYDSTVNVWDLTTARVETLQIHTRPVMSVAFSSDDKKIASTAQDGTIKIWDRKTAHVQTFPDPIHLVEVAAISRSGRKLAVASHGAMLTVQNLTTKKVITLEGHSGIIEALDFSPDEQELVIASYELLPTLFCHSTKVWDLDFGHVITSRYYGAPINALSFGPNEKEVALGLEDGTIQIWAAFTGALRMSQIHSRSAINAVAYSLDGRRLASASSDATAKVWDVAKREVMYAVETQAHSIRAIAFRPNSEELAFASHNSIKLWNISKHQTEEYSEHHKNPVACIALSNNKERVVSGDVKGMIKVWNAKTGESHLMLTEPRQKVNALALSPDAKLFASASDARLSRSDNGPQVIRIRNTTTGEVCQYIQHEASRITAVAFSPNGECLASASVAGDIMIWDVATRRLIVAWSVSAGIIIDIAFSPCGRMIASADEGGNIKVWDAELALGPPKPIQIFHTGRERPWADREPTDVPSMFRLSFSADSAHLFTDLGDFGVGQEGADGQTHMVDSSQPLYVDDDWIYCGPVGVLRLPQEIEATRYAASENWITIGTRAGRVLTFCIDRASLFRSLNPERG